MPIHPLQVLSRDEIEISRQVLLEQHPEEVIVFREIFLQEPAKEDLLPFLELEHSGRLTASSPRPPRLAKAQYDVIGTDKVPTYHESVIDVETKLRVKHEVIGKEHHASLTV